jgi:hypothetical protein
MDRVVRSLDGFNSYLLIVDELSRYCWVFLCSSKEPPIDEVSAFLDIFGWDNGGIIRCNQGGELAKSNAFVSTMLRNFNYVVEPMGADSLSQNGGIECFNQTLGTMMHCLLNGASLPAAYWSYALVQAVYLLNCLIHSRTKRTPYKGWWGTQPDLSHLWGVLAHKSVSSGLATDTQNLMVMISPTSFWVILPRTTTSSIWIWYPAKLSHVTMRTLH